MELTDTNSPFVLFLECINFLHPYQLYICQISLAAMEERVHPNPFRTRKLSSPSPMILRVSCGQVGRRQRFFKKLPAAYARGAFLRLRGEATLHCPFAGVPV